MRAMRSKRRDGARLPQIMMFAVATVGLAACSTVHVDSEYDKEANFARFKTFRWVDAPPVAVGDPRVEDTALQARVQLAVNRELEAKGLRRVESGASDLLVNYYVTVEEKMTGQNVNDKYGYSPGGGWTRGAHQGWAWGLGGYDTPSVPTTYYEEGTVIIDMVDPTTKQLIWRGTATTVVNLDSDQEVRRQRLNDAIQRIFTQYPPG